MTTAEIDAALDVAEAVVKLIASIAPQFVGVQKAMDTGEFTPEHLERFNALRDFIDKVNP